MAAIEIQNSRLPKTGRRRLMGDDRGQSLVEFALVSTVFFMTMFGTIIFGIGVWRYNMVADLAQEGARWASVHGTTSLSPATQVGVQTYVQSRAPFNVTVTTTPAAVGAAGSTITVRVQRSFAPSIPFLPHATLNLVSDAQMTVSR
jgi:Flp pilus assembly protein TadG